MAVDAAVTLERPLLIKGEPGTGKTMLAEEGAQGLGKRLIQWHIKSTTKAQQGLYEYDAVSRLRDSQLGDEKVYDIASGSERTGVSTYGVQFEYNSYGYQTKVLDAHRDGSDNSLRIYHEVKSMNARGQVTLETRGGTHTTYVYDDKTGRLCYKHSGTGLTSNAGTVNCDNATPGSGLSTTNNDIQDLVYKWDTLGNLQHRWEYSGSKQLQETFAYDKLNRLTQAQIVGGAATDVSYDSLGNIASKTGVGTYTYGSNASGCTSAAGPHAVTQVNNGS